MAVKKAKKRAALKKAKRVTKVKKVKVLPKKMSALITLALKDLAKAEAARDKYFIDMGGWHIPTQLTCTTSSGSVIRKHNACSVCFAGAVMAFSLDADPLKEMEPSAFGPNMEQLSSLNELRSGFIENAYNRLTGSWDNVPAKVLKLDEKWAGIVPDYDPNDSSEFHTTMKKVAVDLKKAGL